MIKKLLIVVPAAFLALNISNASAFCAPEPVKVVGTSLSVLQCDANTYLRDANSKVVLLIRPSWDPESDEDAALVLKFFGASSQFVTPEITAIDYSKANLDRLRAAMQIASKIPGAKEQDAAILALAKSGVLNKKNLGETK